MKELGEILDELEDTDIERMPLFGLDKDGNLDDIDEEELEEELFRQIT